MVAKYHNTKRKENINGKLRSIYVKDKSDKEYIRYGSSRYVAIRKSRKQKGGVLNYTEVDMSQVIASVAVFYVAGQKPEFYAYNQVFTDKEQFKDIMTYNNVFRGIPTIPENDAKIYFEFKNALAIKAMKDNKLLPDTSEYLEGQEGFMKQQVVSICFDCTNHEKNQYILFTLYMIEETSPILEHYNKIKPPFMDTSNSNKKDNEKDALRAIKNVLTGNMEFFLENAISEAEADNQQTQTQTQTPTPTPTAATAAVNAAVKAADALAAVKAADALVVAADTVFKAQNIKGINDALAAFKKAAESANTVVAALENAALAEKVREKADALTDAATTLKNAASIKEKIENAAKASIDAMSGDIPSSSNIDHAYTNAAQDAISAAKEAVEKAKNAEKALAAKALSAAAKALLAAANEAKDAKDYRIINDAFILFKKAAEAAETVAEKVAKELKDTKELTDAATKLKNAVSKEKVQEIKRTGSELLQAIPKGRNYTKEKIAYNAAFVASVTEAKEAVEKAKNAEKALATAAAPPTKVSHQSAAAQAGKAAAAKALLAAKALSAANAANTAANAAKTAEAYAEALLAAAEALLAAAEAANTAAGSAEFDIEEIRSASGIFNEAVTAAEIAVVAPEPVAAEAAELTNALTELAVALSKGKNISKTTNALVKAIEASSVSAKEKTAYTNATNDAILAAKTAVKAAETAVKAAETAVTGEGAEGEDAEGEEATGEGAGQRQRDRQRQRQRRRRRLRLGQ
jgi:hypothetical protein